MDHGYSWARKIVDALSLMIDHCAITCGQRGRYHEARELDQLTREFIKITKKNISKEKKKGASMRKQHDAVRLEQMPPVDVIKAAVKLAMMDLHAIRHEANTLRKKAGVLPDALLRAANVIIAGCLYLNGYAGRSKEWQTMPVREVLPVINGDRDYIIASNHKTVRTYGVLGKYICPGNKKALEAFVQIRPFAEDDLLLRPTPIGDNPHCCIATLLRRFGGVYLHGYTAPATNLIRKWFHSIVASGDNEALRLLSRFDGHSEAVAKAVYAISSPERDSDNARKVCEAILGGTVEWPSAKELATVGINDVKCRFARAGVENGSEHSESNCSDRSDQAPGPAATCAGSEAPQPRRFYRYRKGGFDAVGPKPNLIKHQPIPEKYQTHLDSPPDGKRNKLTDAEKAWSANQCAKDRDGAYICPDTNKLDEIIAAGKQSGQLSAGVTKQGLRSHLRRIQEQDRERVRQQHVKEQRQRARAEARDKKKQQAAAETDERSCGTKRPVSDNE
jgi:hypothetical protein